LVRFTVKVNFFAMWAKPGAINFTKMGANITPSILNKAKMIANKVHAVLASLIASGRDF